MRIGQVKKKKKYICPVGGCTSLIQRTDKHLRGSHMDTKSKNPKPEKTIISEEEYLKMKHLKIPYINSDKSPASICNFSRRHYWEIHSHVHNAVPPISSSNTHNEKNEETRDM